MGDLVYYSTDDEDAPEPPKPIGKRAKGDDQTDRNILKLICRVLCCLCFAFDVKALLFLLLGPWVIERHQSIDAARMPLQQTQLLQSIQRISQCCRKCTLQIQGYG